MLPIRISAESSHANRRIHQAGEHPFGLFPIIRGKRKLLVFDSGILAKRPQLPGERAAHRDKREERGYRRVSRE
jgi:hypothetical protein